MDTDFDNNPEEICDDNMHKSTATEGITTNEESSKGMSANTAWYISIVSLLIVCGPLLMGIGIARGWNTIDGVYSFKTVYDPSRFWPEPNEYNQTAAVDEIFGSRNFKYAASLWYYWKLRPGNSDPYCDSTTIPPEPWTLSCMVPKTTAVTRAFVWMCYVVHQCAIWALTYKAQREHARDVQYHSNLRWYNVWSLIVNLAGYLLHLLQTHLTYDATAQDVTESSSQGSVIMLLVMVLLMEYKNRGLLLGWPAKAADDNTKCSWRLPTRPIELVRKYHGYAFSWATIYTLWYHPMEPTAGHVMGFLHTGFLLIQQSLMFTPIHVNKYWKLLLETWVAIHGGIVALQMGHSWAMFLFGFFWMFAFTAIHGIPYYLGFVDIARAQQKGEDTTELLKSNPMVPEAQWKRCLVRLIPPVLFLAIVVIFYSTVLLKPDGSFNALFLTEIIRIPAILYLMVFFTCFVAWGMQSATNSMCKGSPETPKTTNHEVQTGEEPRAELEPTKEQCKVDAETGSSEDSLQKEQKDQKELPSPGLSTGTVMAGFAVCYMLMVAISIVIEQINVDMVLILLTFVLVIIFTILALVAMILMDKQMHRTSLGSPKLPSKND